MKKAIMFSAVALAFTFSACNNSSTSSDKTETASQAIDTTKLSAGVEFYQCEMHPEVMSDKPGTCSKCGMDLVKVEKK